MLSRLLLTVSNVLIDIIRPTASCIAEAAIMNLKANLSQEKSPKKGIRRAGSVGTVSRTALKSTSQSAIKHAHKVIHIVSRQFSY